MELTLSNLDVLVAYAEKLRAAGVRRFEAAGVRLDLVDADFFQPPPSPVELPDPNDPWNTPDEADPLNDPATFAMPDGSVPGLRRHTEETE